MASTGNAVDFGDLIQVTNSNGGRVQSPTRGVIWWFCTFHQLIILNIITISTLGNAADFGDLIGTKNINSGGQMQFVVYYGWCCNPSGPNC